MGELCGFGGSAGGGFVVPAEWDSTAGADENLDDIFDSHDGLRDVVCALFGDGEEA